jgi:hypothetical protein
MTARRLAPADLPDWPRLMRADLAAAYVGVARETFELEVDRGVWPKPIERAGNGEKRTMKMWDRRDLDAAVDRLASAGKPSRTLGGVPGTWAKSA